MSALADAAPDAWVPVPLRARHVVEGDVMVGRDHRTWLVALVQHGLDGRVTLGAMRTADTRHPATLDPDEPVTVLMPVCDRDAVEVARDVLGARLIDRVAAA